MENSNNFLTSKESRKICPALLLTKTLYLCIHFQCKNLRKYARARGEGYVNVRGKQVQPKSRSGPPCNCSKFRFVLCDYKNYLQRSSLRESLSKQCFPRVPTAGQNGHLLGLYWPATFVEEIKSCYPEVKASESHKRL